MNKIIILALLLASTPVLAVEPKERTQGYSGACTGDALIDGLTNPLWGRNTSNTARARVACSADTDVSQQGTTEFGGVISNNQANNRTVDCVAHINSGGNGVVKIPRSIIVGPYKNTRIRWYASDMGGRVFVGGQSGFTCTLPPGMSIQWIYTLSVNN